jgi:tetratricopeptide (TPR) repeat protein
MYQKASHLKNKGRLSVSKRLFELLEEKKYHLWGVYFHFGEMCLMEGEPERAEDFFKKCLTHNPYHKKAGSYLKLKKKALI